MRPFFVISRPRLSLVVAFLSSTLLLADQVTLKNGDTISGQIIKKDGDKLTIKSEFLGEVTMTWSAITSVKSDSPLYVKLPSESEVNGKVSTEGSQVQIQTRTAVVTAPLAQVTTVRDAAEQQKYERFLNPGLLDLWAGYVDLGFALVRGNSHTDTLTTAFNADRITNNDKTNVFLNQIYSTGVVNNVSGTTADAVRGGISYDHNISKKWYWEAFSTGEYDTFQSLDYRFVGGGGLGYHAIKTGRTVLDLQAGGDYTREVFTGDIVRNLGEVNFGNTFTHKLSGVTSVNQSFTYFIAPSNGQYRFNFNLGAATTLHKWLSWQISASDRYLSAPVFGRKTNDVFLTTGLRATFAR